MLLVKQGASVQNCSKEIYFAMGVFAAIFTDVAGLNVVITAGTDGQHNIGSLHSRGLAIDIRNKTLTAEQKDAIFTRAKAQLETLGFDVIREEEHSTSLLPVNTSTASSNPKTASGSFTRHCEARPARMP
jgi:thioredoxin reductase